MDSREGMKETKDGYEEEIMSKGERGDWKKREGLSV